MSKSSSITGKILYGVFFVLILPLLLVLWAIETESFIHINAIHSVPLGVIVSAIGYIMIGVAMATIIRKGKGLPMNAYPPKLYVHTGIYRFIPHPIYTGFAFCCFGAAILGESRSGFWFVAPIATLGCAALVMGFERQDLIQRFGSHIQKTFISLPRDSNSVPMLHERISVFALVLLPWVLVYEAFVFIGVPYDAIIAYFPFEYQLPVLPWTEIFYGSTYLLVILVPAIVRKAKILREFSQAGLIATLLMVLLFIAIPLISPPRNFSPGGILGDILQFERNNDTAAAAFPSYHVVWAILASHALAKSFPRTKVLWWVLAILIALSCVTTGMHAIVDVAAGILLGILVVNYRRVWETIRRATEGLANSWKEWHGGNIRLINHGAYAAAGTAIAILIVGILLGSGAVGYALIIAFSSLITAALWAQIIEGSPSLLRPYGFYGGVIGIVLGTILSGLLGGNIWSLLAAFAVTGPIVQAMGRMRCLVQGCCHGKEAPPYIGIRYIHDRSRVCRLANLKNVPVHPTPLYSILWNAVTGILLMRLWSFQAEFSFITGMFLILNGLGRFVEEAYRGEPQTPILGRLRLYQLMAILSVIAGAILTSIRTDVPTLQLSFDFVTAISAAGFGLVTWFALGVDFPSSNKRFARLV